MTEQPPGRPVWPSLYEALGDDRFEVPAARAALLIEVYPAGTPGEVKLTARNAGLHPLTQQEAAMVLRHIADLLAGNLLDRDGSWRG